MPTRSGTACWPPLLLVIGWLGPAVALESAPVASARATASLVSDTDTVAPGRPFRIGLWLRLAPGWHTYWQNPGDAGLAPELELDLPSGATAGPIAWPVPQRILEGALMTYSYTGDVLLPVTVTPAADGSTTVKAHANWLVCRDICVPEDGDFQLDLPAGAAAPSAQAPLFAAFDRKVPPPSPWQTVAGRDGTLFVQGAELTPATVVDAWFIPDTQGAIRDSAAQPLTVRDGGFTLALQPGKAFRPEVGLSGILSIRDRSELQTNVVVHAGSGAVPLQPPAMTLLRVLGLAFLGGLILNLMPCVFPVLALKVVGLAGASRAKARWHAVAYTVGVLVAFAGLCAALLAARTAGAAAGWGFQFQSPVFVAAMTWLLFAVGLNLSGVYEFGSGLMSTGHGLAARPGTPRQLLHRTARGCRGDALHCAVHGCRHRRRTCRAAGGDDAGVPCHGAWVSRRLTPCWRPRRACGAWRRNRDVGWRCCARRWPSRCMVRAFGCCGCSARRPAHRACWRPRPAWC